MKTRILFFLLTGCLLIAAAWLTDLPNPVQADEVPEKYRETVHKGLEYLVKNQHKDGHWEGNEGQHPVAMTGLAGLALLMETAPSRNFRPPEPKYSANIRKAADWLIDKSQVGRDGLIFSGHASETGRYMQGHGLAVIFLAGVYEHETYRVPREKHEKLRDVLTRAVKYIVHAQSTQGGWYHTSKVEGHDFDLTSATVIQIQALQAAENVISVPTEAINDAHKYLKMALAKYKAKAKPGQSGNRPAETAAALACRTIDKEYLKDELCMSWLKYCRAEIPVGRAIQFGRDDLTHYYYGQAEFNLGGDIWSGYRTAMFDHLQSCQNKDGSWPSPNESQGGFSVGPVHAAAVWCTILQLDKKSHPSMRRLIHPIN